MGRRFLSELHKPGTYLRQLEKVELKYASKGKLGGEAQDGVTVRAILDDRQAFAKVGGHRRRRRVPLHVGGAARGHPRQAAHPLFVPPDGHPRAPRVRRGPRCAVGEGDVAAPLLLPPRALLYGVVGSSPISFAHTAARGRSPRIAGCTSCGATFARTPTIFPIGEASAWWPSLDALIARADDAARHGAAFRAMARAIALRPAVRDVAGALYTPLVGIPEGLPIRP